MATTTPAGWRITKLRAFGAFGGAISPPTYGFLRVKAHVSAAPSTSLVCIGKWFALLGGEQRQQPLAPLLYQ